MSVLDRPADEEIAKIIQSRLLYRVWHWYPFWVFVILYLGLDGLVLIEKAQQSPDFGEVNRYLLQPLLVLGVMYWFFQKRMLIKKNRSESIQQMMHHQAYQKVIRTYGPQALARHERQIWKVALDREVPITVDSARTDIYPQ